MEDYALHYLLSGNAADCTGTNGAIAQAKAFTIPFSTLKSAGDDPLRYSGEQVALVYDWCYSQMAPADAQLLRDRWAGATAGPTDPIHAPTDLGSVAGTSVLTSSSSPFLPNMAGNDVVIISSGGANCKAGMYGILTYTDANTITLDADPTNGGNASGCIGRISGYVDGARPGAWNGQWNGTVGPGSNYNWGFFRNEVLWGVTLAGDSTYSTPFLDASLGTQPNSRWNVFLSYANGTASYAYPTTNASGGILTEGSQYGQYSWGYQAAPNVTSGLLGRDLFNESNWFIDAVYYIIYSTTVGPTLNNATSSYFQFFTMSDTDVNATSNGDYPGVNIAPIVPNGGEYASTMLAVANEYSTMNVGKLARQWLNTVNPGLLRYQAATDPGGAGLAFSNLPLDYYSDGLGMLISKNSWSASATQMRTISSVAASSGHGHRNSGDFAMLRNGAWLTRESASYSTNIVGPYGQTHAVSESVAHNTIALGPSTATTCNIGQGPGNGYGQTVRLESQPLYSYQVIDLSSVYRSTSSQPCRDDNPYAGTVQREFLFIRSMETLVIFDRVLAVDSPLSGDTHPVIAPASVVKTVYVHSIVNPTLTANTATFNAQGQTLKVYTLLPASPSYNVVAEGSPGQQRLEIGDTGQAQSYFLNVMQARDGSTGQDFTSAQVVDNGTYFTLTLQHPTLGTAVVTFVKGPTSTGGTFGYAPSGTPTANSLATAVNSVAINTAGITWNAGTAGGTKCDINGDGKVDQMDVNLAIQQALGLSSCVVDLHQTGVCNVVDVQRVINASITGVCRTGP